MTHATATYEFLSSTEALITVDYPSGGFGMERVTKPRNGDLYEAAYNAASVKATLQGYVLGRFSKAS
jgi:hypothetical protein